MSYFIAGKYALSSYLEYPTLVLQDVCLLGVVMWFGSKDLSNSSIAALGAVLVALVAAMVGGLLADTTMTLLAVSCA